MIGNENLSIAADRGSVQDLISKTYFLYVEIRFLIFLETNFKTKILF